MTERRCSATTKTGQPCKAQPLKDQDVCLAHADEQTRESTGFVAANGKGGRKPNPRMVDLIRERMEAEIDEWHAVLVDARQAERAIVVGNGPKAYVEQVPDHPTRLAALREALDRSYGRPKQVSEISGPEGEPVRVELPSEAAWHADVARVLAESGALKADDEPEAGGS